jgi:Basic region leucine zipper/CP2 transcription factor
VKDLPISYVDQDVVYHLSILDTGSSCGGPFTYHTVVRVCREDDQLQQSSRASTPSKKPTKDGVYTIEYAPISQDTNNPSPIQPILHSCFRDSFSVTWSLNAVTGGSYCLIPIKLRTAGTRQSVNLKLYVGTERIRAVDATVSMAERYQESFARIKLFAQKDAQNELAQEIANVEQNISELELVIAQARRVAVAPSVQPKNTRNSRTSRDTPKGKTDKQDSQVGSEHVEELSNKLLAARKVISSVRPVQVFRLVVPEDGEHKPFHIPCEQKKSSKNSTSSGSVRKGCKRTKVVSLQVSHQKRSTSRRTSPVSSQSPVYVARIQPPPPVATPPMCFYVRPEHLPGASYRAIYPAEQSYGGVVASISSKFEVDIADIGLIYFYNENMAPVIVDDSSFLSLRQEQDLIVQFPFEMHSFSGQTMQPLGTTLPSNPHSHDFGGVYGYRDAYRPNDSSNMFDHYLSAWTTSRQDDSYGDSVDSWSEITDMTSSFTRCSTAQTSMPSEDICMDSNYVRDPISVGTEVVDRVDYDFRGLSFAFGQPQAPESVHSLTSEDPSILRSQSTATPIRSTGTSEKAVRVSNNEAPADLIPPSINPPVTAPGSLLDSDAMSPCKDSLEKNRVAAAKCRLSRKAREQGLIQKLKEKAEQNAKLRKEVSSLETQVREVRELVASHNTCA